MSAASLAKQSPPMLLRAFRRRCVSDRERRAVRKLVRSRPYQTFGLSQRAVSSDGIAFQFARKIRISAGPTLFQWSVESGWRAQGVPGGKPPSRAICATIRRLTPVLCVHGGFTLNHERSRSAGVGARSGEVAMKASLLFLLTVTVLIVGALAVMNNACKSTQHAWCAPMSALRHHIKTEHS
jgi:hypothetical protein